ncbi:SRPBCC family protein [Sphingobium nicotianae]|uniref:SRPBCC family protein n=1 Tax=Sphingobium nicotianae TaxID=2782607 RepID=A0A9X1AJ88_9SPHN|nr:SRPBCC family protein [Sphingobium nicotianae]MBT2185469.1 SRPBCC family protein [Sphingobium nicotianae]
MAETRHDTFTIERRYPHSPEKVFAAISSPELKPKWFAVGRNASDFSIDFRVGGREHQLFTMGDDTPFPGTIIENDGRYEDIVPNERIVHSSTMTLGGRRISSALITYEVAPAGDGARLRVTHQAVFYEGADGPDMRKHGWEVLVDNLSEVLDA